MVLFHFRVVSRSQCRSLLSQLNNKTKINAINITDHTDDVQSVFGLKCFKFGSVVNLSGLIQFNNVSKNTNIVAFYVPEGYRPDQYFRTVASYMNISWDNPGMVGESGALVTVGSTGEVVFNIGDNETYAKNFFLNITYIVV